MGRIEARLNDATRDAVEKMLGELAQLPAERLKLMERHFITSK
jgi:hypothetical protein